MKILEKIGEFGIWTGIFGLLIFGIYYAYKAIIWIILAIIGIFNKSFRDRANLWLEKVL